MSRLQERIRRALRSEARPIGFGSTSRAEGPSLLLLASLPASAPKGRPGPLPVDAILFRVSDLGAEERGLRQAAAALDGLPWGVRLAVVDGAALGTLKDAGADYLVFDAEGADAALLLEETLGLVMTASLDVPADLLRSVEDLPLDALLVDVREGPLTVRRQMELRRLASLTRQRLLLQVSGQPEVATLACLRDAGAVGIVVEAQEWAELAALEDLHQRTAALPVPRRRRGERPEALLPRISTPAELAEEEARRPGLASAPALGPEAASLTFPPIAPILMGGAHWAG